MDDVEEILMNIILLRCMDSSLLETANTQLARGEVGEWTFLALDATRLKTSHMSLIFYKLAGFPIPYKETLPNSHGLLT